MKVLCSLLGYFLFVSAFCKAQPSFWSDPTEDPAVNNVLSQIRHLQPLVSKLDSRDCSEPDFDKLPDEMLMFVGGKLDFHAWRNFRATCKRMHRTDTIPATVAQQELQLLDNYRYANKDEKVFELVRLSLCKDFPETDKTAWGVVVDNAYILKSISRQQLNYAEALEKSLVHRPQGYQYPAWCSTLQKFRRKARVNRKIREDIHDRIQKEVQAVENQQPPIEDHDDFRMDKLVTVLLFEGDAATFASVDKLNLFFAERGCDGLQRRFKRFSEYYMLRVEDPSISRIDKIKQYLSEATDEEEISLFKMLKKLENLQRARMTIIKVNRILKERDASLLNVDSWMVKLLAGSPGMEDMDQGNIKIAFVKARALLNLFFAKENCLPEAVRFLLENHKSFPENFFEYLVQEAVSDHRTIPKHHRSRNMAIITMLMKHPSLSKEAFEFAIEYTFQYICFKDDSPEMLKLILSNQHTHHFYSALENVWYKRIKRWYPEGHGGYVLVRTLESWLAEREERRGKERIDKL